MDIGLHQYLIISAFLFCCGLCTIVYRRNTVAVLMGIELMLNAANINFVAFAYYRPFVTWKFKSWEPIMEQGFTVGYRPVFEATNNALSIDGQMFAIFVIILAAAEAAVALAIVIRLANHFKTVDIEKAQTLKG